MSKKMSDFQKKFKPMEYIFIFNISTENIFLFLII